MLKFIGRAIKVVFFCFVTIVLLCIGMNVYWSLTETPEETQQRHQEYEQSQQQDKIRQAKLEVERKAEQEQRRKEEAAAAKAKAERIQQYDIIYILTESPRLKAELFECEHTPEFLTFVEPRRNELKQYSGAQYQAMAEQLTTEAKVLANKCTAERFHWIQK